MEFDEVVTSRRMTRSFAKTAVPRDLLHRCVDLASRAPSAGKTQGWHLVVTEGDATSRFWNAAFPVDNRSGFRWPHLFDAPVVMLACADAQAYVRRYSEDDKTSTGLGESVENWPTPYWTVDASFAVMTLLLALEDAGLGALFFAVFQGEQDVRREFQIPNDVQIIGAIATGYARGEDEEPGVSASRPRHSVEQIIHYDRW